MTAIRARRVHYAWVVAGAGFAALLSAAAFRAVPGVLLMPLQDEFGWSRATIAGAVSVNLVIFGLSGPFAAQLVGRHGLRRVVAIALALIAAAAAATPLVSQAWHLYLLWGVVVGSATGAVAPVLAAMIATRWFSARQGLVTGLLTAANSTGQLVFLPLMASLAGIGWRWAMAVVAGAALVALPLAVAFLRDRPADVGLRAYGAAEAAEPEPAGPRPSALGVLREIVRDRVFWVLAGSFFVCGATTVGLIAVHLIPAAHDHGIGATAAAGMLAAMGVLDIAGTTASGWLTDRHDPRRLLAWYYGLRGLSLLLLPHALATRSIPLGVFVVFYGLDWIATVPPTVAICARRFGTRAAGIVFGWVFAAHQIGGAAAAWAAGLVRDGAGTYGPVFVASGILCLLAALLVHGTGTRRRERAAAAASAAATAPTAPAVP